MIRKLSFAFLLLPFFALSQRLSYFTDREFNLYIDSTDSAQTSLKSNAFLNYSDLLKINQSIYPRRKSENYFFKKIRKESLVSIKEKDFFLLLDPVFDFSLTKDMESSVNDKLYNNSRGLWLRGNVGNKFAYESVFIENQSSFPTYLKSFVDTYKVVPGQGRWKNFKSKAYDYAYSAGTVSFLPFRNFSIQAGHGKPFYGTGYRSLLLSDNAFNFPFAKLQFKKGKFSYSFVCASLQIVNKVRIYYTNLNEPLFEKKSANFHYLTYFPRPRLHLSLFQGTVFRVRDAQHPYFNWSLINPIIFGNAIQYGLSASNNVILGADFKGQISKNISFYGQYIIDDHAKSFRFNNNKTGFQLGVQAKKIFRIKNLFAQFEYNRVRPYVYSSNIPSQSYSHYGQALAHPLGANFQEAIAFLNYRVNDFFIEMKGAYAEYGSDTLNSNFGKNVFAADRDPVSDKSVFLQGMKTSLIWTHFKIAYLINPSSNMNVFMQADWRSEAQVSVRNKTLLLSAGIKTSLFQNYYDF